MPGGAPLAVLRAVLAVDAPHWSRTTSHPPRRHRLSRRRGPAARDTHDICWQACGTCPSSTHQSRRPSVPCAYLPTSGGESVIPSSPSSRDGERPPRWRPRSSSCPELGTSCPRSVRPRWPQRSDAWSQATPIDRSERHDDQPGRGSHRGTRRLGSMASHRISEPETVGPRNRLPHQGPHPDAARRHRHGCDRAPARQPRWPTSLPLAVPFRRAPRTVDRMARPLESRPDRPFHRRGAVDLRQLATNSRSWTGSASTCHTRVGTTRLARFDSPCRPDSESTGPTTPSSSMSTD